MATSWRGYVMLIQKQKTKEIINNHNNDNDPLFERKIENATVGLSHDCFNWLERVGNANNNKENVIIIANTFYA
jgi:hypothetical protein